MEDVLSVYERPYDPRRPVVCVDEGGKELRGTPRQTIPAIPGAPARQDYEYERHGTCNLFLSVEPLAGKRRVRVTQRRTGVDFAHLLRAVIDEDYPQADQVVLVCDNLNTHSPACLYEAFAPAEARRIASKIEWHYTPEHGSGLNMAEIELSVLSRQCLNRRMLDQDLVADQAGAWEHERNTGSKAIRWQFKPTDARIKLARLYPVITDKI